MACAFLVSTVQADLVSPVDGKRPPIANSGTANVLRGATVELTLSSGTGSSKDVSFQIEAPPQHGKLLDKDPKQVNRLQAKIRYQADLKSSALQDEIRFTCRIGTGPVSQVGVIKIQLLELTPKLESEKITLDFANVRYGTEMQQDVTLRNTGTGVYNGEVQLPEGGWHLPEGTLKRALQIPAGGYQNLTIIFKPARLGEMREEITFTGTDLKIGLRAKGTSPFMASSALFLVYDPKQSFREGTFALDNPGLDPLEITLALAQQVPSEAGSLEFPSTISLKPHESLKVPVKLVKNTHDHYRATIVLSCMGANQEVSIGADPSPASIEITGDMAEGGVEFGDMLPDEVPTKTKTLILRNHGGSASHLFGLRPRNFVVEGFEAGVEIPAKGELKLPIKLAPTAFGKLLELVEWTAGTAKINFSLRATVALKEGGGSGFGAPSATYNLLTDITPLSQQSPQNIAAKLREQHYGRILGNYDIDLRMPPPKEFRQVSSTKNSITLTWQALPGDDWKYTIFSRGYSFFRSKDTMAAPTKDILNTGTVTWETVGKLDVTTSPDGKMTATMRGVNPNWNGTLAVMATGPNGKSTRLSEDAAASVTPYKPWDWKFILAALASIVLVGFGYLRWKRNRWFNKAYQRTYRIEHNYTDAEELVGIDEK